MLLVKGAPWMVGNGNARPIYEKTPFQVSLTRIYFVCIKKRLTVSELSDSYCIP